MASYDQLLLRQKQIEEGLLELMQTVPYSQITVTSLADHLGLSRKCFYHYFPNKEACLDSLMIRTIQECALFISRELKTAVDLYHSYEQNFIFWKEHRELLDVVAKNGLILVLLRHFIRHVRDEEKQLLAQMSGPQTPSDPDVLVFFVTGHVALLMKWAEEDYAAPPEVLAEKLVRLLHTPLLPVKEP